MALLPQVDDDEGAAGKMPCGTEAASPAVLQGTAPSPLPPPPVATPSTAACTPIEEEEEEEEEDCAAAALAASAL